MRLVDRRNRTVHTGRHFADWNPLRREMLISTRFGDTPQLHLVKSPGGARQQLTFLLMA